MGNATSTGNHPPHEDASIENSPDQPEHSKPSRQEQQRAQQQQKRDDGSGTNADLSGGQEVSGKDGQGNIIPQV